MSGPFDSVTPIGERARRPARRDGSAPSRRNGHAPAPDDARDDEEPEAPEAPRTRVSDRELTHTDAQRMVAITARRALQVIENPTAKDADKKHAAVSMGVAIDKWLALTGRPARPEAASSAEATRDGVLELALRVAESTRRR